MIANTNDGGRKAAGQDDSNNAMGDNMVAPKTGSTDQNDKGKMADKISESRTAPPTRRSSPHTSPLCARLGDAAGKKNEATPDGRGELAKELSKESAQHDVCFSLRIVMKSISRRHDGPRCSSWLGSLSS